MTLTRATWLIGIAVIVPAASSLRSTAALAQQPTARAADSVAYALAVDMLQVLLNDRRPSPEYLVLQDSTTARVLAPFIARKGFRTQPPDASVICPFSTGGAGARGFQVQISVTVARPDSAFAQATIRCTNVGRGGSQPFGERASGPLVKEKGQWTFLGPLMRVIL